MNSRSGLLLALCLLAPVPMAAQPSGPATPGAMRSELRLQLYHFDNFMHATTPAAEIDVTAYGAEYRVARGLETRPVDLYGHANVVHYDESGIDTSFGGRLGGVLAGERHYLNAYLDHQENRPSFEVGDVFGRADSTSLAADYNFRLTPDWQLGAEGLLQRQSFQDNNRDNEYQRVGASVRYRGFGWYVSPEIGFTTARRSVEDAQQSYDEDDWYVQVYSLPAESVYLSLRYLHRDRSYTTGDPASSNFGRSEDRGAWTFVVDWTMTPRLSWLLYYSTMDVDSTRTGGDFDTGLVLFGPRFRL